jgi:hypothetical protein
MVFDVFNAGLKISTDDDAGLDSLEFLLSVEFLGDDKVKRQLW